MPRVSFHDRRFRGVQNYDGGDFNQDTRFVYHEHDACVRGTFAGGGVQAGVLLAKPDENGILDMQWLYLDHQGEFHSGTCTSTPECLPDGRIRLHESWKINDMPPVEGTSIIEEY